MVASGGIRIQEGLLSLAQVAKTVAAADRLLASAHQPLIDHLAPTIGAAYAGFVGLSDVTVAEPGAIIGYASTRLLRDPPTAPNHWSVLTARTRRSAAWRGSPARWSAQ